MERVRVIIADVHPIVRAGVASVLGDLPNLEVVGDVGDGDALWASLAQHQADLLLTDVCMPGFEAIEMVRQIRERYPLLKILIFSAYTDLVYVHELLGAGVGGYHLKDQPLGDLRLAVQRVLDGQRWLCGMLIDTLVHTSAAPAVAGTQETRLSARQRDILRCLHEGLDNRAIARWTGLSVKTIEKHLSQLYRQIHVESRLQAANYLAQHPDLLGADSARPLVTTAPPSEPKRGRHAHTVLV